jgi:3-mercaptopyruvate sulfurtransferase SseA
MINRIINFIFVLAVLLSATMACNFVADQTEPTTAPTLQVIPTQPQGQSNVPLTEADVPRISVEEARVAVESGEALLVDVRSAEAFAAGHAAGAISIPLVNFERDPAAIDLKKDQWIITYCT